MRINKRINYIYTLFKKIGVISTLSYFTQRILKSKGALICVHVPGLEHSIYLRSKTDDI